MAISGAVSGAHFTPTIGQVDEANKPESTGLLGAIKSIGNSQSAPQTLMKVGGALASIGAAAAATGALMIPGMVIGGIGAGIAVVGAVMNYTSGGERAAEEQQPLLQNMEAQATDEPSTSGTATVAKDKDV